MSNRHQRDESEWAARDIGNLGAAGAQLTQIAARNQAELLNLLSRRASAYLEYPARLSHCRSPADLWREQLGFLTAMQRHYFEASQHFLEATLQTSAATAPEENDSQVASESAPGSETRKTRNDPPTEHVEPKAA